MSLSIAPTPQITIVDRPPATEVPKTAAPPDFIAHRQSARRHAEAVRAADRVDRLRHRIAAEVARMPPPRPVLPGLLTSVAEIRIAMTPAPPSVYDITR